jgi:hypothetical protein
VFTKDEPPTDHVVNGEMTYYAAITVALYASGGGRLAKWLGD